MRKTIHCGGNSITIAFVANSVHSTTGAGGRSVVLDDSKDNYVGAPFALSWRVDIWQRKSSLPWESS